EGVAGDAVVDRLRETLKVGYQQRQAGKSHFHRGHRKGIPSCGGDRSQVCRPKNIGDIVPISAEGNVSFGFAAYVEVFERSLLARLVTENQQMHVLSSPPVNELNKRLDQDVHTFPGLHMSGEYDQKATARDSELSVSVAARARSETVGVRAQVD